MTDLSKLFNIGYSSACHDRAAVTWDTFEWRGGGYDTLRVHTENRNVTVTISPKGRSVRVFVDGVEVK